MLNYFIIQLFGNVFMKSLLGVMEGEIGYNVSLIHRGGTEHAFIVKVEVRVLRDVIRRELIV
jgi:hypothetical protein